jgi:aspartate kinase
VKVCKFGGSSLADAAQILKVCGIVKLDPERRLVVVSAPGKRDKADVKVTDLLIRCAEQALAGSATEADIRAVADRYAAIQRDLALPADLVQGVERDLRARLAAPVRDPKPFTDAVKALGEEHGAKFVAAALRKQGVDARYINPRDAGLVLSDDYGNAQVLPESYERLRSLREAPGVGVFPGFFGHTRGGEVVTFPRGGSDITGAILAAAVNAELYENFTDVDSVFAVPPDVVPTARPIPVLTYREMRELAYSGFDVFHDEAIVPAVHAGIPICIKNTNRPDAPGTLIVPSRTERPGEVVGIASGDGFCTVFVGKYLMNREIGFGRRLLQILEEEGLSFEHTPSGIDNISVILREKAFSPEKERHVVEKIRTRLQPDDVSVERGLALIMIVGEGMRYTVGLASKATMALARAGVNIEMMNQGSSEISMMFGVKSSDRRQAVAALYHAFFEDGP